MKVYRKEVLVLEINQEELDVMNRALGLVVSSKIADKMYAAIPAYISDADEE